MDEDRKTNLLKVGAILVVSLALLLILRTYFEDQEIEPEMSPPSTEWTTAPEGGVEVDLPETPMRNVPVETPEGEVEADTDRERGQE